MKKGFQIIEIDGRNSEEILNQMHGHFSSDGINVTLKNHFSSDFFNLYYYIAFGVNDSVTVKMIDESGDTLFEKWSLIKPSLKNLKTKFKTSKFATNGKKTIDYGNLKINNKKNYAYLVLPSFKYKNENAYHKFLDENFEKINNSKVDYLVIDLRNNLGGVAQGYLMGYLTDRNSLIVKMDCTNKYKPKYKKYYKKWNLNFMKYRFYLWRTRREIKKGKDKFEVIKPINPKNHELKKRKKIIVLTNGLTFSSGANLSANLKDKSNAIIIGEESGGSYKQGNTGNLRLKLPNTKFSLYVNPIYFNNCVELKEGDGGVLPDIIVHEQFGEKKKNDPYIIKLEEYIKQNNIKGN